MKGTTLEVNVATSAFDIQEYVFLLFFTQEFAGPMSSETRKLDSTVSGNRINSIEAPQYMSSYYRCASKNKWIGFMDVSLG